MTLPRIGTVRLHEHRPGLRARIDAGTMRILPATVRMDRGRWFVAFQVEEKQALVKVARPDAAVGIDLGIKTLVALATRDTRLTGTGVAGDLDPSVVAVPKPRGADRKTRTTRPRRTTAGSGRAGGTVPGPRAGTETGDRQQVTRTQLALW